MSPPSQSPPKEVLLLFQNDVIAVSKKFNVTAKAVRHWFKRYGIYNPKKCNRLNKKKAKQIRDLYFNQNITQVELAEKFNVCQATINKIINNKSYPEVNLTISASAYSYYRPASSS